jgi:hypothetical protein
VIRRGLGLVALGATLLGACQASPSPSFPSSASPSPSATADPGPLSTPTPSPFVAYVPGPVILSTVVPIGRNAFAPDQVELARGCRFTTTYPGVVATTPPCLVDVVGTNLPVLNAAPEAILVLSSADRLELDAGSPERAVACGQVDPATRMFSPSDACHLRYLQAPGAAVAMPASPNIWVLAVTGCASNAAGAHACGTWFAIVDTQSAGWTPLPSGVFGATMPP